MIDQLASEKQKGFYHIMHYTKGGATADIDRLEKHPFDLLKTPTEYILFCPIFFIVGSPGYPESSNQGFAKILRNCFAGAQPNFLDFYLRIISAECIENNSGKHHIFYEIGFGDMIYICHGGTDFSGGGKCSKESMDCIFNFLSSLYNKEIKKEKIPYSESKPCLTKLGLC